MRGKTREQWGKNGAPPWEFGTNLKEFPFSPNLTRGKWFCFSPPNHHHCANANFHVEKGALTFPSLAETEKIPKKSGFHTFSAETKPGFITQLKLNGNKLNFGLFHAGEQREKSDFGGKIEISKGIIEFLQEYMNFYKNIWIFSDFFLTFAIPAAPGENPPSVSLPLSPPSQPVWIKAHLWSRSRRFLVSKGRREAPFGQSKTPNFPATCSTSAAAIFTFLLPAPIQFLGFFFPRQKSRFLWVSWGRTLPLRLGLGNERIPARFPGAFPWFLWNSPKRFPLPCAEHPWRSEALEPPPFWGKIRGNSGFLPILNRL